MLIVISLQPRDNNQSKHIPQLSGGIYKASMTIKAGPTVAGMVVVKFYKELIYAICDY